MNNFDTELNKAINCGIQWLSTEITTPDANREIIAKNTKKVIANNSAAKRCRVMKFNSNFTEDMINDIMIGDGLTLWAYVGDSDE